MRDIRDAANASHVGFEYGPNRERVRRIDYAGMSPDTVVHVVGSAEIRYGANSNNGASQLQEVRRLLGNVISVQTGSGSSYRIKRQVLLADAQGSTQQVLAATTLLPVNAAGNQSFDAWGQRRDADTWGAATPSTAGLESRLRATTTHGYTGHEMAQSVGMIQWSARFAARKISSYAPTSTSI